MLEVILVNAHLSKSNIMLCISVCFYQTSDNESTHGNDPPTDPKNNALIEVNDEEYSTSACTPATVFGYFFIPHL